MALEFRHSKGMKCKVYLTGYEEAIRTCEDEYTYGTIVGIKELEKTYKSKDKFTKETHTYNRFELLIDPSNERFNDNDVSKFLVIEHRSNSAYDLKFTKEPKRFVKKICREVKDY